MLSVTTYTTLLFRRGRNALKVLKASSNSNSFMWSKSLTWARYETTCREFGEISRQHPSWLGMRPIWLEWKAWGDGRVCHLQTICQPIQLCTVLEKPGGEETSGCGPCQRERESNRIWKVTLRFKTTFWILHGKSQKWWRPQNLEDFEYCEWRSKLPEQSLD